MGVIEKSMKMGLGLAVAAAAGAYFLKKNPNSREKVRGWMLKLKGDVLQQLEKVKSVNQETYIEVVDKVGERYKKISEVNRHELKGLLEDLKASWSQFSKKLKDKQTQAE